MSLVHTENICYDITTNIFAYGPHSRLIRAYYFPIRSTGSVPFVTESRNNGKDRNISLVCVSEPSLTNCYESGSTGLSSFVLMTLDHLRLCHQNNGTPSIHWRNCFGACKPNPNIDSFPFYFKPLNPGIENKAKTVLYFGTFITTYSKISPEAMPVESAEILNRLRNRLTFAPVWNFSFRP